MDARSDSRVKHIDFIIIDLLCVEISFVLAIITRYGFADFVSILTNSANDDYRAFRLVNVVLVLAYLVFMLFTGPHTGIVKRGHLKEFWNVFIINAEILFTLFAFLYVIKVSAISLQSGFSSPQRFNVAFRKLMGMTPMEYRKRHLK